MTATYSFLDVNVAIVGPGGGFSLGAGSGNAEEGITIEPVEDIDTMTIGADGSAMHSLHASKGGKCTVRLLKTSPTNALLSELVAFQRTSGANHGQNVITLINKATFDIITMQQVAFSRLPNLSYAKEGGVNEWEFNSGIMDYALGNPNA